jgi:hypothetical protein
MTTKICNKCKIEKDVCEFNKKSVTRKKVIYYKSLCKNCQSQKDKNYRENNKEKYKEWYNENREERNEYRKLYYEKNKNKILNQNKKQTLNKKIKFKIEYHTNPITKLKHRLSCRLREILKIKNIDKQKNFNNVIGCSIIELKEHLESKFSNGMNWENHGLYGWHIDHIIPLSSANTEEDLYKLCHYTNLQPLWAKDNLKKSNKIIN